MDQGYFQDVIAMATIDVARRMKGARTNDGIPR